MVDFAYPFGDLQKCKCIIERSCVAYRRAFVDRFSLIIIINY